MSESTAVIVAAFIAAGAALWIGWLQYIALQHQNKWSMREARPNVYNRCRDMLAIASQYELTDDIRNDFLRCQIGAGFLFGGEVVAFLKEAREQMHAIDVFKPANNQDASSENRAELLAKYHSAWNRAAQMLEEVDAVFAPYLDFKNMRD